MKTTFNALVNNSSLTATIPLKDIFSDQGVIPEGSVIELDLIEAVLIYPANKAKIRNTPIQKQSSDSCYIEGAVIVADGRFSGITVCIRDGAVVFTFNKLRNGVITEFEISGEVTVIAPKKKVMAVRPEMIAKAQATVQLQTVQTFRADPETGSIVGMTYKVTSSLRDNFYLESKSVFVSISDQDKGPVVRAELEQTMLHDAYKFVKKHSDSQLSINRAMFRGTDEEFMDHYSKVYHYVEV